MNNSQIFGILTKFGLKTLIKKYYDYLPMYFRYFFVGVTKTYEEAYIKFSSFLNR